MTARDQRLELFERERPRLFAIGYRMLGSAHETEDLLQDGWLRWQSVDLAAVENPSAYLVSLITRLCIDQLRSAHARRMEYVGPWLPEPLVEDLSMTTSSGQGDLPSLALDLSTAFMVLLERLSPVERAVFLLRESFDFDYRQIAEIVGKTEANCRQIDRRARQRLAEGPRFEPADHAKHEELLDRFLGATREGDVDALLELLAEDAVVYSDGGGKVVAARNPVIGSAKVARFLTKLVSKAPGDVSFRLRRINGQPGIATYFGDRLHNVLTIYAEGDRIHRIFIVVNPDKLPGAPPVQ